MPQSNCCCSVTPEVHAMIDANVQCSGVKTMPKELMYVQASEKTDNARETLGDIKPFMGIDENDIAQKSINDVDFSDIIDGHIKLNTKMFNYLAGNTENLDKEDIPSLAIISTMDMEFAHINGYNGKKLDTDEDWARQIENMEKAMLKNTLRLFPLFSYDPRRYRLPVQNESVYNSNIEKNCKKWDEPFARIVGCKDTADGIKKRWLGFYMNPNLGFRPFDEFCEYLPGFYGKCEAENIPILAHCAPEGITTHDAMDSRTTYKNFDSRNKDKRAKKNNARQEKWWPNAKNTQFNSDIYCGRYKILNDKTLNYFYQNYGHPNNWDIVLQCFPKLRLCLSSFGGNMMWGHRAMEHWTDDYTSRKTYYDKRPTKYVEKLKDFTTISGGEWIYTIIQHTKKYPNVYTDISCLDINNPNIKNALKRILLLAFEGHDNYKHLKDKIIFGSGWYMALAQGSKTAETQNSKTTDYNTHCNDFKELFKEVESYVHNLNSSFKTGYIWRQFSIINPWNFYAMSKRKFKNISSILSTTTEKTHQASDMLRILFKMDNDIIGNGENSDINEADNNLRLFSNGEFNAFMEVIKENLLRQVRLNCIIIARNGLRRLLSNENISVPLHTMDEMMEAFIALGYADKCATVDFEIANAKLIGYQGNSLSKIVRDNIDNKNGYYLFGISICHARHAAILVAKVQENNVEFNIFDQHGSLINRENNISGRDLDRWHDDKNLDMALLNYTSRVRILAHNEQMVPINFAKTITVIYLVNKKGIGYENK